MWCKWTNLLSMPRLLVSPTYLIVTGWGLGLFVNLDPEVEIYLQGTGTSSSFFSYLSFTHCFVDDTKMINIRRGLKLHPLEQKYPPTNLRSLLFVTRINAVVARL